MRASGLRSLAALADRAPERTRNRRNRGTTQIDIRFGVANAWSCGHGLSR